MIKLPQSEKKEMKKLDKEIAKLQANLAAMRVLAALFEMSWFQEYLAEVMKKDASKRKKSNH